MNIIEFKTRLTTAFKAMRAVGLIARQNYLCCQSCAGYDVAERLTAMPAAKRAKVIGCAFYTRQDWDGVNQRHFKGLYVAYGPVETQAHGEVGLPTEAVGHLVHRCLEDAGLPVDWDGRPESRIFVRFSR